MYAVITDDTGVRNHEKYIISCCLILHVFFLLKINNL